MTANALENLMAPGLAGIAGDPLFLGLAFLSFFVGFVMLQRVSGDMSMLIITPAAIMAAAFIPALGLIALLALAYVIVLALTKFMNR
jgi:hypothetical protein